MDITREWLKEREAYTGENTPAQEMDDFTPEELAQFEADIRKYEAKGYSHKEASQIVNFLWMGKTEEDAINWMRKKWSDYNE